MDKINQVAANLDKMRGLTGFADSAGDLTKDLFTLLALLELYSSAYLEADCYFARAHNTSSIVNPPKDRLLCYLQLVSHIKKAATTQMLQARKAKNESSLDTSQSSGGGSDRRSASTSRSSAASSQMDISAIKSMDLSNAEELLKLKGVTMDEQILRHLLKCFQKKQDAQIQEERLQSESAVNKK